MNIFEIKDIGLSYDNKEILQWVNQYISDKWSLSTSLNYGIAVHDGTMPKHLLVSIMDLFNNNLINTIFCTSTIIEGVNTNAENVIYFDNSKGLSNIDFFDYANIRGRAGRLMQHYVGHIYNFNSPPKKSSITVDIPFHEQSPIQDEVLINLDEKDVLNKESDQFLFINSLSCEERKLFSSNHINIREQKKLFDYLLINYSLNVSMLNWNAFPNKQQRDFCIKLIWDYLIIDQTDKKFFFSKVQNLIRSLSVFLYEKNINSLIKKDIEYWNGRENYAKYSIGELYDHFIQRNFKFLRLYIQFKIPKWFSILDSLQKAAANIMNIHPGDYSYYIRLMENNFIQDNLVLLDEYGVPNTALYKLQRYVPDNWDYEQVVTAIDEKKLYNLDELLEYEKRKLKEIFD